MDSWGPTERGSLHDEHDDRRLSATEGHVRIGGYDIFEQPNQAKRLIGYLPEQPPLYMNETPEEYLRFVGEPKGCMVWS